LRVSILPPGNAAFDSFAISPDGRTVVFSADWNMDLVKTAIAGGEPIVLRAFDQAVFPTDWSSDGSAIAYTAHSGSFGSQAWILPLAGANQNSAYAVSEPGHNSGGAIFYPKMGRPVAGLDCIHVR
jgi:hypothetical protein